MIYKIFLKTIRGCTKGTDLVIRTNKFIKISHETVPLSTGSWIRNPQCEAKPDPGIHILYFVGPCGSGSTTLFKGPVSRDLDDIKVVRLEGTNWPLIF
jgi:hypothetical protein